MQELNPIEWAIRPIKKYTDFSGRAPRAEYWWYTLATTIVGLAVFITDFLTFGTIYGDNGPLSLILEVTLLIPGLAVLVRRLHDTEKSGWWALIIVPSDVLNLAGNSVASLTPYFGHFSGVTLAVAVVLFIGWLFAALAVFIFTVTEGTQGPNRYGPDPYGPDQLEEVFA